MTRRRVVESVFEGIAPPRPAIQVEANNKEEEYALSDTVGISVRVPQWAEYFSRGGPYGQRQGESRAQWAERVAEELKYYPWPDLHGVVADAVDAFRKAAGRYAGERYIVFKVLGPTETAETFFAPPVPEEVADYDQTWHRYDFAVLLRYRPDAALALYDKIAGYVYELVRVGSELDVVDAVRVADDAADYRGPLYPPRLMERYYEWHGRFVDAVVRAGKVPMLHCDGNVQPMEPRLGYRGIHPVDIAPKTTLRDAYEWGKAVAEFRARTDKVFVTGMPIDLIFNEDVSVDEFLHFVKWFVDVHGVERLLLSTTHRPYPLRGYHEEGARTKVLAVRRAYGAD